MLIITRCDHCQAMFEVSEAKLGQMIVCHKCDGKFVMRKRTEADAEVFAVAEEEADVQETASSDIRATWKDGKHDLRLPPPPPEDWNADDSDVDSTGQRFGRFRPSRKELDKFLDPEAEGDDRAMYLLAGLAAIGLVGVLLLVALILFSLSV